MSNAIPPPPAFPFHPTPDTPSLPGGSKVRRVSLALPSSPRVVPVFRDDTGLSAVVAEQRGKMSKISDESKTATETEKKQRKKWSAEETQMLVNGCNKHGVGNWKAILKDAELVFDGRSAVDLKDRFRTYFPDAYRTHYPNAKTHLSTKVRSTLPDGSPLFEKTRSKKRRPFTEEEDRALKAGYEQHGTVWATIVKNPVFQDQNRRSTDLRDRFRNAFPELYQAAGYKPRGLVKKRAMTKDDSGPVRRGRTSQGGLRGGTKSVPQSTTNSDNEESEDDSPEPMLTMDTEMDDDAAGEMDLVADFAPCSDSSLNWSSGVNTPPTTSMIGKSAWGTEDWFSANPRLDSAVGSSSSSPFDTSTSSLFSFANLNHGMMDLNHNRFDSGVFNRYDLFPSSLPHEGHQFGSERHASFDSHSAFDASSPDFASEVGDFDSHSHSAFSDPEIYPPNNNFRGFTHHSSYAGDLIFGARTHQPLYAERPTRSFYAEGFGFGGETGVHPMQLHTPAFPGIDEIPLAGITLEDRGPRDESMGTAGSSAQAAAEAPKPQPGFTFPPHELELEALVNLSAHEDPDPELHATPPGTPVIQTHSIPSYHSRSFSVPPSERIGGGGGSAVAGPSRPSISPLPHHANSQPTFSSSPLMLPSAAGTRSLPRFSSLSEDFIYDASASSTFMPTTASPDPYDLPFLDLHYYGMTMEPSRLGMGMETTTTALDLAQSYPRTHTPVPPPPPVHNKGGYGQHQRGQSVAVAVTPTMVLQQQQQQQERKRSSWGGGAG